MLLTKSTNRLHYALLGFLVFLSLAIRAGYIYQHRADTWEMSFRVVTISDNGSCLMYTKNPLSPSLPERRIG